MKYIAPRKYFWGILLWFAFNSSYMAQDLPVLLSSKSEETETGLRIEFQFSSHIERADVSSWIEQKNWFILNFYNIIRPEPDFFQNISSYPIQDIQQSWSQNALQLSIQISLSIGMFDVIIDDKNNLVNIVLTFKDFVEEKEINPSFVFPDLKDAQKKAHPTTWKDARERTTLTIMCDTKGLPIYVDGHLVGYSPLKNPVDILPGWHKVGYFPNNYSQDVNALTSKEKIMNDILVMGRLDVFVDEGAHETIVLNYQTLGEEVVDYNKRFQAGAWIGFSLFFMTILLMSWGVA
tara:strand:+ start:4841 stop:5716 length:876 start_codon:yes stop_codon:yes gene_type:complete